MKFIRWFRLMVCIWLNAAKHCLSKLIKYLVLPLVAVILSSTIDDIYFVSNRNFMLNQFTSQIGDLQTARLSRRLSRSEMWCVCETTGNRGAETSALLPVAALSSALFITCYMLQNQCINNRLRLDQLQIFLRLFYFQWSQSRGL